MSNSNNNNRRGSLQPLKAAPSAMKPTAMRRFTSGSTSSSSSKGTILPDKVSVSKKKTAASSTQTHSQKSVSHCSRFASTPEQYPMNFYKDRSNSDLKYQSGSHSSSRSSRTSTQHSLSPLQKLSISEPSTAITSTQTRSPKVDCGSSQRAASPREKRKLAKQEVQKAINKNVLPPIDQLPGYRTQVIRRSSSMTVFPSCSREECDYKTTTVNTYPNSRHERTASPAHSESLSGDAKARQKKSERTVSPAYSESLSGDAKARHKKSERTASPAYSESLSGDAKARQKKSERTASPAHSESLSVDAKAQHKKSERTVSPTCIFVDMLKSVRSHCGVEDRSVKYKTLCELEHTLSSGGIVGLANLGNTCYMNSTLQCLSHTVEMTQAFLGLEGGSHKRMSSISGAYAELMQSMWLHSSSSSKMSYPSFDPLKRVKDKIARIHPAFVGYGQQDSQEFMRVLLSELHENLKTSSATSGEPKDAGESAWATSFQESAVSRVFMGQLKSTLSCTVCRKLSVTFDPFWDLSLPIQAFHSTAVFKTVQVEDCLNLFTKEEVMDEDNKPYCPKCKKCQRSTKQMTVHRFPPVLVLHLMRFSGWKYRSKLNTPIDVSQILDLTSYASPETAVKQYKDRRITYELYAMSNHSGSCNSGHYTAIAKHFATNRWYTFNDSRTQYETYVTAVERVLLLQMLHDSQWNFKETIRVRGRDDL